MDEYLRPKKYKRIVDSKKNNSFFGKYILKTLILVVLTLCTLIILKSNTKFKTIFYKEVYDTHFSFAKVNDAYKNLFGSPIPFVDLLENKTSMVFNEKIKYNTLSKYYDGVVLNVDSNLNVPVIESGMVVFVGEKENFGNTIIIEQVDGTDVWYGNMTNINVKMYDFVEKGSILGNVIDNNLYLVFYKDDKIVDYKEYLEN